MGDIKKFKKKYDTPMHPWNKSRIGEERTLTKQYGLTNKKQLWKMSSLLSRQKDRAKLLIAQQGTQSDLERDQLLSRTTKLGLIKAGATFDDILGLSLHSVMNRRLDTLLVKKHLARTPKQARQMIIHRHVLVGGKMVTSPSFLVSVQDEGAITFATRSPFLNEAHPERLSEAELEKRRANLADKKKDVVKKDEEPPAFDEKSIKEAEALVGESKEGGA